MRARTTKIISDWFHRCLTEDQICRSEESTLPTRVLDVGNESRDPCLYETHREKAAYTVLSHCWGGPHSIRLTTTSINLKGRMNSIPMSILPRTFADAVLLTRELGIKYIWIDSLCIIQNDAKDWQRESAHMAKVYQNATLTISADSAPDGSKGLFQPAETPLFHETPIPFQSPTGSGLIYARESDIYFYGDRVHSIGDMKNEPLQQRGWVLQEWLLSNRIVHFTTCEVLWECKAFQFCQCQTISQPSHVSKVPSKRCYYNERGTDGNGHLRWRKVVENFTERQLTKKTDRLPALSGLAAFNKPNAAEDYVAGLWKSDLPGALLWEVRHEKSERFIDYYAPSWSWASIHGRVDFTRLDWEDKLPIKCQVLEIVTVPATDNPFGPLKSGFIKIQGLVGILPRNMEQGSREFWIRGTREEPHYRCLVCLDSKELLFEVTSADEVFVLLVQRETVNGDMTHSIVLKKKKDECKFMRVGYGMIYCENGQWESCILGELEAKEQIVTIE